MSDDDEDITGEQDTDDFLAVLDLDDEPDPDIERRRRSESPGARPRAGRRDRRTRRRAGN